MFRKAQIVFLILLGSYPLLYLYAQNHNEMDFASLAPVLALSIGISVITALSWYPILHDWTRSASMAAWLGFSFWLAGYISNTVLFSNAASGIFEGSCSVLIFAVIYLIGRNYIAVKSNIDKRIISAAAMISGILILYTFAVILPTEAQRLFRGLTSHDASGASVIKASTKKADMNTPDIIDIVLDGYARGDILESRFKQSNTGFLNGLRKRGFHVLDTSTSNYSSTALSLTSMLNMNYVKRPDGFIGNDMKPVEDLIQHNAVFRFLKERGYWTVNFSASCSLTEGIVSDEYRSYVPGMDPFYEDLINLTPLSILMKTWSRGTVDDPFEIHRRQVTNALNGIATVNDAKKPIYAFAHVVCPHPPFIFKANGQPAESSIPYSVMDADDFISLGGTKDEYMKGYREQVTHLNTLVLKSVDRIKRMMHRPTIIIIHSDHGSGLGFDFADIRKSDLKERLSNLMAIYFPDGDYSKIYPSITGVNIYRVVLSKYMDADLPLIPDKHFFSSWKYPYNPTPITLEQINKGKL